MQAAILFEPDAFVLEGRQIMGRRAAGSAFLRAAVEGRGSKDISAYVTTEAARVAFIKAVGEIDPAATAHCILSGRLDQLASCGTLYRPDPSIAGEARIRLRQGIASYSICGITHTVSSARILDSIGDLLTEPVMEWDAIICTSSVAQQVLRSTLDQAWDQLRWLTGATLRRPLPQLPIIPLGVHCSDWSPSEQRRAKARVELGLDEDEIALLFAGRLSFAGKAHPFQMLEALERVAARSGNRIALIMAGQYSLEHIQLAFEEAANSLCPNVRYIHVDGSIAQNYSSAFAAADIFISLSDSHQETFGITPVEAMASGLPVVVSDWNGYRDTVRHGVDGFRVSTWAPGPDAGQELSRFYESTGAFEQYSMRASGAVSIDMHQLTESLTILIGDVELRKQMGSAGRLRTLQLYDWRVVYGRYLELWQELAEIRQVRTEDSSCWKLFERAPQAHFSWPDPFDRFAAFPTYHVGPGTVVDHAGNNAAYADLAKLAIFKPTQFAAPIAQSILDMIRRNPTTIAEIARDVGLALPLATELVSRLAKMNLVRFRNGENDTEAGSGAQALHIAGRNLGLRPPRDPE